MIGRSGFTADSWKRILLGPAAVFFNYDTPAVIPVGVSRGGNSFNPGVTYRDIDTDTPVGLMKGWRELDDVRPTITTNTLEISPESLIRAIPGLKAYTGGAAKTGYTRLRLGDLGIAHYIDNIAIVATVRGSTYAKPFIGLIYNALGGGDIELSFENKSEPVMSVTFTGMFDPVDIEALNNGTMADIAAAMPFEIQYPTFTTPPA